MYFFYTGQALVQSLERIGQPFIINTQLMQKRGIDIVYMDRTFDNIVTKIVRCPEHGARRLCAAAPPARLARVVPRLPGRVPTPVQCLRA